MSSTPTMKTRTMPYALRPATFALLLAAFLLPDVARAQDDPNRPVLPDIAPRVVEIRGQLEISFPSIQRQPLIGFNPPPRVVPIPPERRPWVDAYKQLKADLPPSPLRPPEPPAVSALQRRTPRSGELEGSFGRYFSRLARARVEAPIGTGVAYYTRLDYRGTEGHEPDYLGLDDVDASFDALEGVAGVQTTAGAAALGAEVDGLFNDYALYAAGGLSTDPSQSPTRQGRGLGGAAWLRTQGTAPVDGRLRLHYGDTAYETDPTGLSTDDVPATERREQRFTAAGTLDAPFGDATDARLDARFTTAAVDLTTPTQSSFPQATVRAADAMAGVRYRYSQTFDVFVGARLLSYATDAQNERTGGADASYVAPEIHLNMYPARQVAFYVQNRPGVDFNTLADVFRRNPYLVSDPALVPTVRTVDAEGGMTIFLGPVELDAKVGYRRSPNYLYFEGVGAGFHEARYGSARIVHVGGDLSVVLPAGFNASVGATFREGLLLGDGASGDDVKIPNFGPVVGRSALSYSFLDHRGLLQLTGTFERARYRSRPPARRLGDFFDLDLLLSYDVSPSLGIVVRAENLSNGYNERWDLYEQAPFVVTGGFRVLW